MNIPYEEMIQPFLDLVSFVDDGKVSERLRDVQERVTPRKLRLAAIHVLSWLRRAHLEDFRPRIYPEGGGMMDDLRDVLAYLPEIQTVLFLRDNAMGFADDAPDQVRNQLSLDIDSRAQSWFGE